jgi:hypothetical protein
MLNNGVNDPPFSNEMLNILQGKQNYFNYLKNIFSEAYVVALKKFEKHIDNHSAINLFRAIRCFDPQYLKISNSRHDISLYNIIPEFRSPSNNLIAEWNIYCGLDEIYDVDFDLDSYWREKKRILPYLSALAETYIWLPISGVDVECSFSNYKNILNDKRHALSNKSIEMLNVLYFNKNTC